MKISKRTREQAALICAIAASTDWSQCDGWDGIIEHSGDREAVACAVAAWLDAGSDVALSERWAEAESLLRTGWSP